MNEFLHSWVFKKNVKMKYLVVYKQYKTKFNIALFLGLSSFDSYHPGK